jgi:hypothetical protein
MMPGETPLTRIIGDAELPPLTPSHHIMGMPLTVPRFTVDDLDHFPDDGWKYELVEGSSCWAGCSPSSWWG